MEFPLLSVMKRFECFLYKNRRADPKISAVTILDARGEPMHKQKIRKWAESLKWY